MAKKVNIDEIDAEFIINSFSSRTVPPSTPPPKQESKEVSVEVEAEEVSVPVTETKGSTIPVVKAKATITVETKVEQSRKRKSKVQDYEECFLKKSDVVARYGKTVYLRATHHDRMQRMVQTLKKSDVSVSSYLDNIISNHFDNYQDEVTELYDQNNQPIFQKE